MTKFRLYGYTTTFLVKKQFLNSVGTKCVIGVSMCGTQQTVARLVDVIEVQ